MYIFVVIYGFLIIGLPLTWIVAWRSQLTRKKHTGMRAEVYREELLRLAKAIGPMWLLMMLAEIAEK